MQGSVPARCRRQSELTVRCPGRYHLLSLRCSCPGMHCRAWSSGDGSSQSTATVKPLCAASACRCDQHYLHSSKFLIEKGSLQAEEGKATRTSQVL